MLAAGGFSSASKRIFDSLSDIRGYHSKAHGEAVAEVAEDLCYEFDISKSQTEIIVEAARWHDVGCLLGRELLDHENLGVEFVRNEIIKKYPSIRPFMRRVAEYMEKSIVVQEGKFMARKPKEPGSLLEAADLVGQFAHPCYIPMLKNLHSLFFKSQRAFQKKTNPYCNIDDLLYDDYIYKHTEAFLSPYLEIPAMAERKLIYYTNKRIRALARAKHVRYSEVIGTFKRVAALEYELPRWTLGFTLEHVLTVEAILDKM